MQVLQNYISSQTEIIDYIAYGRPDDDDDILKWWRENEKKYPGLSILARSILAIPALNASSERGFSTCGRIVEERRTYLNSGKC